MENIENKKDNKGVINNAKKVNNQNKQNKKPNNIKKVGLAQKQQKNNLKNAVNVKNLKTKKVDGKKKDATNNNKKVSEKTLKTQKVDASKLKAQPNTKNVFINKEVFKPLSFAQKKQISQTPKKQITQVEKKQITQVQKKQITQTTKKINYNKNTTNNLVARKQNSLVVKKGEKQNKTNNIAVKELTDKILKNINNKQNSKQKTNIKNTKGGNMENLKISFLGGVDEIGKNMTVFEYGKDIIIVDSGLAFPDDDMPGVDLVVQDVTYLVENKDKIRGIFITHGHEDHIGSINYLLDNIKAPIYGSRVSLGLIENKLREAKKTNIAMKSIQNGSVIVAGSFRVEFVQVTHSIPGAMALAITTPAGVIVHSGDFKIDFTPIGNDYCDLKRLAEIGKAGVTLLMCESTNVEREGFSMSESVVGKTLDGLFEKLKNNRIIIATFASNINRLQQIITLAEKYKRKIAFTGRSMINVSDMAIKLGELKCNKDIIIDIDKIESYDDKELIIVSTGSQGESMSALTRMASDNFPKIKLGSNDAVILSSAPIPGNEKAINTVINNLYRKDCKVIYNELADVHASGHAYKEELKILHSLILPKFFIPVHGEFRHLKNHQMLAKELGMKERDIIIPELGMQVEMGREVLKVVGTVPAGEVLIDGTGVGDKDSNVIRDRITLSQDGVCAVVVTISAASGQVVTPPDIISRGFIYQEEASDIIAEAKETIFKNLNTYDLKSLDPVELRATIRKVSTNFFFKKTKRRPMILSIVNEI